MNDPVETILIAPNVVVSIFQDEHAEYDHCDEDVTIAYTSDRYKLGTEHVSQDRAREINDKLVSGEYIGMPVFAYVHSMATVCAAYNNPFHCPWDSGHSGWVFVEKRKALAWFGAERMSKQMHAKVLDQLKAIVEEFNCYLTGDVYGYKVEIDGDEVDSCWGFAGIDHVREEAKAAGHAEAKRDQESRTKEAAERSHWEARDVVTI